MQETVFTNARLVLRKEVVRGDLIVRDGVIAGIGGGGATASVDCEGDWLLPGLVELHTDHLESHYAPRPGVRWNMAAAVQAHDSQIAASGITTVLDALRVGMDEDARLSSNDSRALAEAVAAGQSRGALRAEHFIHLRCEVSASDVLQGLGLFRDEERLLVVSMMDHTPGQRQFTTLESYRRYYQGITGMSDPEFEAFTAHRQSQAGRWSERHRAAISQFCREAGIVLASHDDATPEHVAEAVAQGVTVAEFPTTLEAARSAREAGLAVVMGAPNLVLGGSHSGNVAASALAAAGLLDVLSSDYVPFSLLQGAFLLARQLPGIDLPTAVGMVSRKPAEAVGLTDRGAIELGLRADLVRVREVEGMPVVREVRRAGLRVA